jgi:hypothetical protein
MLRLELVPPTERDVETTLRVVAELLLSSLVVEVAAGIQVHVGAGLLAPSSNIHPVLGMVMLRSNPKG